MRPLFFIFIVLSCYSCKKDDVINPYDDPSLAAPIVNDTDYFSDPSSFVALHNNIFVPTCANSGCHDGAFEPDFRTIESSYNTLVYQPVIKNDPLNSYQYRVVPFDAEMSVMYKRLLIDIDGNSGIMPLTAEYHPEHYWYDNKEEYIENVKEWIDQGARDIFGNVPLEPNKVPEMRGCIAFESGQSTVLARELPRGTIYVPSSALSIDIYFSVIDDVQMPNQLTYNKVKFSKSLFNFESKPFLPLQVLSTPLVETGFYLSSSDNFYHKYTLDMSTYISGDVVFMKIYLQDNVNLITEIPSNGSEYQIVKHFTFTVI